MIAKLKRFLDDVNRIANLYAANRPQYMVVTLSPEDRSLLQNFRRRQTKKVKEPQ